MSLQVPAGVLDGFDEIPGVQHPFQASSSAAKPDQPCILYLVHDLVIERLVACLDHTSGAGAR